MTETQTSLEFLQVERDGHVAIVKFNNPPMNVLNPQLGRELKGVVDELSTDDSVRAVVFASALEGVFIAGADITVMLGQDETLVELLKDVGALFDAVAHIPKPTVCAMGGTTLGGGFELALACDFRFMSNGFGEVGLPEVRLGLLPGGGGTQRLPRLVGHGVATEMIMKGMRYDPETALKLGLVHKLYEPAELLEQSVKYAHSLAAQAPLALQAIKRLLRASFETPGTDGLELERKLFLDLVTTADAKEGITAFFENRKPAFSGS
jgi:enoyl-CoA hydratase